MTAGHYKIFVSDNERKHLKRVWINETWVNACHSVKQGCISGISKGRMAAPFGQLDKVAQTDISS